MGIERQACDLCGQLVALTEEHGPMDCVRFLKEDVKFSEPHALRRGVRER